MGHPLYDHVGARKFGGHTPRVTGATVLATAGMEVNKVPIMARHSGDTILTYVAETPLVRARVRKLEASLLRLEGVVQAQAQDVVAMATAFARTDNRVYVQNTVTAAIHMAKGSDDGRTMCGWPYSRARKRGTGLPYRLVSSLVDMPGTMMCERCLPTERAIARGRHDADLSADEQ